MGSRRSGSGKRNDRWWISGRRSRLADRTLLRHFALVTTSSRPSHRSSGMDIIVARASQGIAKDLLRYSAEPISIGTRCCQDAAMEIRDAVYILQAAIQRSAKIQLSIITQSQNYVMLLVVYGSYRGRYLDAPIAVEELATPLVEAAESSV